MSAALVQERLSFTPEQEAIIRDKFCPDASPLELALFLNTCRRTGLDPFIGQASMIKIWNSEANNGKGGLVSQFVTRIDGLRLQAQRTGQYAGQVGPHWCGPDGVWTDIWLDPSTPPFAARVGVWRSGFVEPIYSIALYKDYCQRKRDGTPTLKWDKNPEAMLAKCAEALSLRRAFPGEVAPEYIREEMEHLERERPHQGGIQVQGSHEAPAEAVVLGEKLVELPVLNPAPEECRMAFAECTKPEQVKEVASAWKPDAVKGKWVPALLELHNKRLAELTPAT